MSSGTLGSPKLLLLSGIGPEKDLEALGIEPRINLPAVGKNLQDHVVSYLGPFPYDKSKIKAPTGPGMKEQSLHQYLHNRTGLNYSQSQFFDRQ